MFKVTFLLDVALRRSAMFIVAFLYDVPLRRSAMFVQPTGTSENAHM